MLLLSSKMVFFADSNIVVVVFKVIVIMFCVFKENCIFMFANLGKIILIANETERN